ncbi:MAG TPA: hypothetical protein VLT87_11075 [Thermoanaerobaculia bacterium]|nr:hypothetical protein [Thermoanaerobaculia bacterium]
MSGESEPWAHFGTEQATGGWTYSPAMLQDVAKRLLTTLRPYAHPGEDPPQTLERLLGLGKLGGPQ